MTQRPIIFNGPMVRAILDGRKTMTRRLLKPQPQPDPCNSALWWTDRYQGPVHAETITRFAVGDRLWVRETWQAPALCPVQYRATSTERIGHWNPALGPWRSPIHMPRRLSRLALIVTAVKVERLQDISEADAIAEGAYQRPDGYWTYDNNYAAAGKDEPARHAFMGFWETINSPGSWGANPWVAAITFRREDRP